MSEEDEASDAGDFTDASPSPDLDATLAVRCAALQALGITHTTIRYSGFGDSGWIDEMIHVPENIAVPWALEGSLRDLAESYFPEGYENYEGGYGSLILHLAEGLAELEHHDCFEQSESMDIDDLQLPSDLRESLSHLGLSRIVAPFSGYGDSGQIEEVECEPESVVLPSTLRDQLEEFLLDQLPDGWELSSGGSGTFEIDLSSGAVEAQAEYCIKKECDTRVTRWQWRR